MSLGIDSTTQTPVDVRAGENHLQLTGLVASGEGELAAGAVVAKRYDGKLYALAKATAVADEVVGAGDGAEVSFSKTLANRPAIPGTITVKATIGAAEVDLVEDGQGRLADENGDHSGLVAYGENGAATVSLTFGTAPDNATNVTIDYEYGNPDGRHEPHAVLLAAVDATSADAPVQKLVFGHVRSAALVWPAAITAANKAWALARLAAKHINAI